MRTLILILSISTFIFTACSSGNSTPPVTELTPEQITRHHLDSLKAMAQDGDIVARLNDNIISYHLRNLNDSDLAFSHAGVVMTRNGEKVVCNIDAAENRMDTVRYDPIDSFLNPRDNFTAGLFRYKIPEEEKKRFIDCLNAYHEKHVHFDMYFNYDTDTTLYCSEMISKCMTKATNGRITYKKRLLPRKMLPLLYKFFEQIGAPPKVVASTLYVPVDFLYRNDSCTELMRFKLKHLPGDDPTK